MFGSCLCWYLNENSSYLLATTVTLGSVFFFENLKFPNFMQRIMKDKRAVPQYIV